MAKTKANTNESVGNRDAIIIAVTIVVLAVIFMFFRDRQKQRDFQLERLDAQMDVWEERGLPRQNKQVNDTTGQGGGKVL